MIDGGFITPKPMLYAGNKTIIEWSMDSIDRKECSLTFIVQKEHCENWHLDKFLHSKFQPCNFVYVSEATKGAADSVMRAEYHIKNELPLIVYCPDIYFTPKYIPSKYDPKNLILTFKANSTNYSYIDTDFWGNVNRTVEKQVISDEASVGIYTFESGNVFCNAYQEYQLATEGQEQYICPLYNILIANNKNVHTRLIDKIYIMGTPEEYKFFTKVIYPYLKGNREFILCCDHSGLETKNIFQVHMRSLGMKYIDAGTCSEADCDYNEYVDKAIQLAKERGAFCLGFCRSGQGINIYANKHRGVRSALVYNEYTAKYAIKHNAANFFSIPETVESITEILKVLRSETFDGGRHQNRMMKGYDE